MQTSSLAHPRPLAARRLRSCTRRASLVLIAVILALVTSGCGSGDDETRELINNAKEKALGQSLDTSHRLARPIVDDSDPVGVWASEFVLALDASSRSYRNADEFDGYTLRLINDASVAEVFSAPAGYLYMTTGTLLETETCAEVAALIAHEMIHITQRHAIDQLLASRGLVGTLELFQGDRLLAEAEAVLAETFETLEFDAEQESEADDFSLQVTLFAEYNPYGLIDVLERLVERGDDPALAPLQLPTVPSNKRLTVVNSTIASRYSIRVERDITQNYECIGTSMTFDEVKALIEAGSVATQPGTGVGAGGGEEETTP